MQLALHMVLCAFSIFHRKSQKWYRIPGASKHSELWLCQKDRSYIELGRMANSISYLQQDSILALEWIYDHLKLRSFISTKGRFHWHAREARSSYWEYARFVTDDR
ncbi:hypothetical protein ACMFMG_010647 [Clarireedia jacksonii]